MGVQELILEATSAARECCCATDARKAAITDADNPKLAQSIVSASTP